VVTIGQQTFEEKKGRWIRDDPPAQNSSGEFLGYKKLQIGESLDGIYKSVKPNPNYPERKVYFFSTKDGDVFGLNSSGDLDSWMAKHNPGDILKITRKPDLDVGKASPMHQFEISTFVLDT